MEERAEREGSQAQNFGEVDLYAYLALLRKLTGSPPFSAPFHFLGILETAAVYAFLFGPRLQSVQSRIASELAEAILSKEERRKRSHEHWLKDHQEWDFSLSEIRVPDSEAWFGKGLADLSLPCLQSRTDR